MPKVSNKVIQERDKETEVRLLPWFYEAIISFAFGFVSGGVCIPFLNYLIYGDLDPIGHGWPLCLHVSALLSILIIALLFRCTIISALGVYAGLVGLMLASGASEYPVASAIGLAIHGLLPAVFGFTLAFGLRAWIYSTVPTSKSVNQGGEAEGL